mmetsp:Transcript_8477/g.24911  ORF Transcript_8477/g.24911 Transcript_8477/m.24911 type:complete len:251 (+) Transcript_8477:61-813(+)
MRTSSSSASPASPPTPRARTTSSSSRPRRATARRISCATWTPTSAEGGVAWSSGRAWWRATWTTSSSSTAWARRPGCPWTANGTTGGRAPSTSSTATSPTRATAWALWVLSPDSGRWQCTRWWLSVLMTRSSSSWTGRETRCSRANFSATASTASRASCARTTTCRTRARPRAARCRAISAPTRLRWPRLRPSASWRGMRRSRLPTPPTAIQASARCRARGPSPTPSSDPTHKISWSAPPRSLEPTPPGS